MFGKTKAKMDVLAAEFLPYEKQLYIIIADVDGKLHVMQYDPERKFSTSHSSD
jgi:cleavage and polyadenylation specificity factor subunit 1